MTLSNFDVYNPEYKKAFKNIINYILFNLGYPIVRVELAEENIITAILEAISLYQENAALNLKLKVVPVVNSTAEIPEEIDSRYIYDVIFEPANFIGIPGGVQDTVIGNSPYVVPFYMGNLIDIDLNSYYLYLSRLEDLKRIMGISFHWQILNNKIVLFPSSLGFKNIGILFTSLPDLNKLDRDSWIKRYALARCKVILGTIRSKISGFQIPGGGTTLDGNELKSEGNEEINKLLEELSKYRPPLPLIQI